MTDVRRAQTHAMTAKLVSMGFDLEFEPRDPKGFAKEMLRTLRATRASRSRLAAGGGPHQHVVPPRPRRAISAPCARRCNWRLRK